MITSNILEVNIDTVGSKSRQRILWLLLLVVKSVVKAKLLDQFQLLIRADRANDTETLALGDLADDLSYGASSRTDEDGLTLLGLSNFMQTRPSSQTRHSKRAKEQGKVEVVRVVDLAGWAKSTLLDADILGDGDIGNDEIAFGKVGVVALEDLGNGAVDNGILYLEGRAVRLDLGVAHLSAQIRVEGGIDVFEDQSTLGCLLIEINGTILNCEVLSCYRETSGDLFKDEGFVLGHDGGLCSTNSRGIGNIKGCLEY